MPRMTSSSNVTGGPHGMDLPVQAGLSSDADVTGGVGTFSGGIRDVEEGDSLRIRTTLSASD